MELVAGTHDPRAQEYVNKFMPVKVFNLSITSPEVIDSTHERMSKVFHKDGGEWQRRDMPRTTFVFLNAEEGSLLNNNLWLLKMKPVLLWVNIGKHLKELWTLQRLKECR